MQGNYILLLNIVTFEVMFEHHDLKLSDLSFSFICEILTFFRGVCCRRYHSRGMGSGNVQLHCMDFYHNTPDWSIDPWGWYDYLGGGNSDIHPQTKLTWRPGKPHWGFY